MPSSPFHRRKHSAVSVTTGTTAHTNNSRGSLLNTFRAHLTVLRAAISDPSQNDVPPVNEHELFAWSPANAADGNGQTGGGAAVLQHEDGRTRAGAAASSSATNSAVTSITSPSNIAMNRVRQMQQRNSNNNNNTSQMNEDIISRSNTNAISLQWTLSGEIFFSNDDEDISDDDEEDEDDVQAVSFDKQSDFPTAATSFPQNTTGDMVVLPPHIGGGDDDTTCNNTIVEKVRQRSKKAVRASKVGAFVTFLKALFGIGMLSNPAVLGEVGLLLGTVCHLFIVVGCAFACYLLLTARQLAKNEVMERERRNVEEMEEWEAWKQEVEFKRKQEEEQQQQNMEMKQVARLPSVEGTPLRRNTSAMGGKQQKQPWPVSSSPNPTEKGWSRCQDSLHRAVEASSPHSNFTEACSEVNQSATPPSSIMLDTIPVKRESEVLPKSDDSCHNNRHVSTSSASTQHRKTTPRREKSSNKARATPSVSDEYHRLPDDSKEAPKYLNGIKLDTSSSMPPPPHQPAALRTPRLVTYGDVAKYLAGPQMAQFIVFTIVSVHLMFASGMLHIAVENLCYIAGWDRLGFSYTEIVEEEGDMYGDAAANRRLPSEDGSQDGNSRDGSRNFYNQYYNIQESEEAYAAWEGPDFVGRLAMASLLFPIIHGLLQIPSLKELATISSVGLVFYVFGCIGSMMYTAVVLTDGHPFNDHPDDLFQFKWSGIPTYVATTIYAIEGINLALPTVNSLEGSERARWKPNLIKRISSHEINDSEAPADRYNSVLLVVGAVFLYGLVTLIVSWVGLAGGLGGGIGTNHGQDGCLDVTYCLNSTKVQFVYMLSLGVALVLTLPVILYPSTEMLEIWLDEREDERRRRLEAEAAVVDQAPEKLSTNQLRSIRKHIRSKSLIDDETLGTLDASLTGNDVPRSQSAKESCSGMIEMLPMPSSFGYTSPKCTPEFYVVNESANKEADHSMATEKKRKAKRKLKYWKLRMFLAFLICFIGTLEGSFPQLVVAAEVIRGVGLSIAGLIFPPLLYMSAVGGRFSAGMASAMALLIGLGLFNIVLVLMSAFGDRDFIIEEGPGHYHDFYSLEGED